MRISDWSSDVCSSDLPPPALLAPLWAPVGLRYHALHHLLPSMPYHSLGEAHQRLSRHLGLAKTYGQASSYGLMSLMSRLAGSTVRTSGRETWRERVYKYVWISVVTDP